MTYLTPISLIIIKKNFIFKFFSFAFIFAFFFKKKKKEKNLFLITYNFINLINYLHFKLYKFL